ncbi:helix-turn-helix domain-containing protein [Pedobacter mendelii]|uniref:AraC family transcriptional regulator n=1 Tax=Pedobacter mendelii TaxID=1908240 RepID=A0ABQ2BKD8_9SPHI|nr:helix-turn-helix domain-containing protein [Pedobacter mendelii]GGI27981.1 AraC family transcriptional regulator [Pedobacter mendelii]
MTIDKDFQKISSLSELHRMLGLPKPLHPLLSLIENMDNSLSHEALGRPHILNYYKMSYKSNHQGKFRYGQHFYDFDEGGLFFCSPNQVISDDDVTGDHSGYTLLVHPDFFLTYPLAKKIKQYGFFSYSVNEALHLSDKERDTIISVFRNIDEELQGRIDDFSQDVIISQIELLLNYANRFYKRQFITRRAFNNNFLQVIEDTLEQCFEKSDLLIPGIPTVQYLSGKVNMSPGYLSDMLRSLTGQNAQQHIHNKLIEKAKEKLSISSLTIGEIAFQLGFEHPQSFSKFFKQKTSSSPVEFRRSFN